MKNILLAAIAALCSFTVAAQTGSGKVVLGAARPMKPTDAQKEAYKDYQESRKEADKGQQEARKEADKDYQESRKEADKDYQEARKEAYKDQQEAQRDTYKYQQDARKDADKREYRNVRGARGNGRKVK